MNVAQPLRNFSSIIAHSSAMTPPTSSITSAVHKCSITTIGTSIAGDTNSYITNNKNSKNDSVVYNSNLSLPHNDSLKLVETEQCVKNSPMNFLSCKPFFTQN